MSPILSRRDFLTLIGAGSAALATARLGGPAFAADPARKPNIVLIVADDLGYAELGCQGAKDILTPNIDSIAKNGVRFTSGYVSCPVCSPTRAGLVTGRYQQRFGHELNPGPARGAGTGFGLPLTETTFAARLKAGGYRTGIVGKWHLGHDREFWPLQRGFDEFYGFIPGGHAYTPGKYEGLNAIMRGNEAIEETEYLTDAFGREAESFVDKNHDKPFFLYLAFNATHVPMQATDKYLKRFPDIADPKRKTFAAMLSAMDDAVGRTLAAIRKHELENDTLIIFISDNGGPTRQTTASNLPFRGGKGGVYEGGVRIPFLMQHKGKLPAGVTNDKPVISLDIAPTALALAGVSAEGAKFDGVSILPFADGSKDGTPHDTLYWRIANQHAIRKGNWKMVKAGRAKEELYDLGKDIAESNNLAGQQPEKLKELMDDYAKWDSQMIEPLWRPEAPNAPASAPKAGG